MAGKIKPTSVYLDETDKQAIEFAQDYYRQRDSIEVSRSAIIRIAISDYVAALRERLEQEQTNDR